MANRKAGWHRLLPVLQAEFNKTQDDIIALRATVATLVTAFNNTLVKLDADVSINDSNYSASYGNQTAPAALTAVGVDWA